MKDFDFVHNGNKHSYRIDLNKVEAYERGTQIYTTGFLGLIHGWDYLIKFKLASGTVDWEFTSETEREKVFKRLEARTGSKAL